MGWFGSRGPVAVTGHVTISISEHERLKRRDRHLAALEANGVDNWDGYMSESFALREAIVETELVEEIFDNGLYPTGIALEEVIIEEDIVEDEILEDDQFGDDTYWNDDDLVL